MAVSAAARFKLMGLFDFGNSFPRRLSFQQSSTGLTGEARTIMTLELSHSPAICNPKVSWRSSQRARSCLRFTRPPIIRQSSARSGQSTCCMIIRRLHQASLMPLMSLLKLYIYRSRVSALFIDICFVAVAILAFADWLNVRQSQGLARLSQTVSYIGRVELVKPWKTSPYIVQSDSSKRVSRFSCFGPYQKQYWCDSFDFSAIAHQADVEILALDGLVYEVRAGGKTLLSYDLQVQRFQAALSDGPSNVKLAFSFLMICILILSIRSRLKNAKRLLPRNM